MSKSALYAGIGQGLMSLGQGVGNAIQAMTLEDLRKKNMQENWARQDAIRKEDAAVRAEQYADTKAYRSEQASTQASQHADNQAYRAKQGEYQQQNQEATQAYRDEQAKNQAATIQIKKDESQRRTNAEAMDRDNKSFDSSTSGQIKTINSIQKNIDKVTNEILKAKTEGEFLEPLIARLKVYKEQHVGAMNSYEDTISNFDETQMITGSARFNEYQRIKNKRSKAQERVNDDPAVKPGQQGRTVDDVLNSGKPVDTEAAEGKKYGQSIGDSLGTNQIGAAIGGAISDVSNAIGNNKLVSKYAKGGARGMTKEQLYTAYERAKAINEPAIAQRILDDIKENNFGGGLMAGS